MFEERYTFGTRLQGPFDDIREAVIAALKTEGFGVLTEIDVAATLKAKLDVDRPPYRILGACNPPFAHRAIEMDPSIGALLPCNVVVRADGDAVVVELMDPKAVLGMVGRPEIDEVATEVRTRLERVVGVVAGQYPVMEAIA
jgi:uncharacterized protein (DUF302 family)